MNTIAITPGTVVAAVDGSPNSLEAATWAAAQAKLEARPLRLVHITGHAPVRPSGLRGVTHGEDLVWLDDGDSKSHEILRAATDTVRTTFPDGDLAGTSLPGDPREVLAGLTTAHLLVLGSRGRGVVRSRLLGSVSARLVKTAPVPVVVVRPGKKRAPTAGVVVAADATPESRPVIEFAFQQASLHGHPLTVMHCLYADPLLTGNPEIYFPVMPDRAARERYVAESLAGLREKYPDVDVTTKIESGTVHDCLAANPRPWELVVVGRHPVQGLAWLSGTTAVDVLERSRSPIAVIPQLEPTT